MTRAFLASLVLASAVSLGGCREEPTIVIKFEPNDLSGGRPTDLAVATSATTRPADLGVAKKGVATKPAAKTAECRVAADCVLEPVDCCDCANGGQQHALSRRVAVAAKSARAEKCKRAVCTMMLSTDPSCGQRADCVNGACVMAKK
jgi:hypothetical protein